MSDLLIDLLVILFSLLVIGLLAAASRFLREIRAARERIDDLGSQVIQTAGGPVEYARAGEGYPVLVVHGAMGGFDQGLWLARGHGISDYQVISVSRFGYLRTPAPEGANLDLQADAFAGLLDALEIRRAAVFAVSAGSTSAIRFAARYPERVSALILVSPDAPGEGQMAMPPRFIFDVLLRSDFLYWAMVTLFGKRLQYTIGLAPRGYHLTREQQALIQTVQLGDLPVSRRVDGMIFETYTILAEYLASVTPASPYPLSRIETPTLVIHAEGDPISTPENVRRLADQMPNARRFCAPDGGLLLLGHMEEVKAEIAGFLRSHADEPVAGLKSGAGQSSTMQKKDKH
jgi:pimeloyl-ACP methyl ester carboxylesterase